MRGLRRARLAAWTTTVVLGAVALSACSSGGSAQSGTASGSSASAVRPARIYPAPAGLLDAAVPQQNGVVWLLAGSASARAIHALDLSSGALVGVVPVSGTVSSLAQSSTGELADGVATATAGAVELRNGSTGALVATIPVGAPVRQVVFGADGNTLYVLDGNGTSTSVTVVDTGSRSVQGSFGVGLHTVAVAPSPDETSVWTLSSHGKVDQVAVAGGQVETSFTVGQSGTDLVVSPTGSRLFVLKGASGARNVAEVRVATEQVRTVLPAPADCVAIVLSADGQTLYDAVGTPSLGNLQAFTLGG
ncbi:MAG: YncE family protein [Acidimicrobiales bacterium]